jgi:hypothetical protein
MPGEYKSKVWRSRRTRRRLVPLLCCVVLALASVAWAARSATTPSPRESRSTALDVACTPAKATAAVRPAAERPSAGNASARTEQTLAVVVEPPECSVSQIPPPGAAAGVPGNLGERIAGPLVGLTLRISPNQQTTCEIVLRDYSHRKHPLHTRTRYCRSNVRRGRWEQRGPAQHLPRWAILTGSATQVRVEIGLSVLGPVAQPLAHATVYLASSAPDAGARAKLVTNTKGSASLLIPYGPTRILTATYPGEGDYGATGTQVQAQFQASTSDFASTRYIARGAPVTFTGALLGAPLPKGGASAAKILVQYQLKNRWVTWGTTRTHGASWRMKLALNLSPRSLTTRAVVVPSGKYPYIEGTSRIVHLYITH